MSARVRFGNSPLLHDYVTDTDQIIYLQQILMDISAENYEQTELFISESIFLREFTKVQQLLSNILFAVEYRPKAAVLLAKLTIFSLNKYFTFLKTELNQSDENINENLSFLKSMILYRCFSYAYQLFRDPQFFRYLFYTYNLLKFNFFCANDIVNCFEIFDTDTDLFNQMAVYFSWFAPEIKFVNPIFYEKCYFGLVDKSRSIQIPSIFQDAEKPLAEFEKDDWKYLRETRDLGTNPHEVAKIISNDDCDSLQECLSLSSSLYGINMRIPPSVFESSWPLNSCPTLIQYAACKGSVKCFRFLFLARADLDLTDERGAPIQRFAVFGGNSSIIRVLDQNKCSFVGKLVDSALFHRNSILSWILERHFKAVSTQPEPNTSEVVSASSSTCFEENGEKAEKEVGKDKLGGTFEKGKLNIIENTNENINSSSNDIINGNIQHNVQQTIQQNINETVKENINKDIKDDVHGNINENDNMNDNTKENIKENNDKNIDHNNNNDNNTKKLNILKENENNYDKLFENILKKNEKDNEDNNEAPEENKRILMEEIGKIILAASTSNNMAAMVIGYEKNVDISSNSSTKGKKEFALLNAAKNGSIDCFMSLICTKKASPNVSNNFGDLLQNALQFGRIEIVNLILSNPMNDILLSLIATKVKHKNICIINYGYINIAIQMNNHEILKLLLHNKAIVDNYINWPENEIGTPLTFAVKSSRKKCIEDIINYVGKERIDFSVKNEDGKTSLEVARELGYQDIEDYIVKCMEK